MEPLCFKLSKKKKSMTFAQIHILMILKDNGKGDGICVAMVWGLFAFFFFPSICGTIRVIMGFSTKR